MTQKPPGLATRQPHYSTIEAEWNNVAVAPVKSLLNVSEKVASQDERQLKTAPANLPHSIPGQPAPLHPTPTCPIPAQVNLPHPGTPVTPVQIEKRKAFQFIKEARGHLMSWKAPSAATMQQYKSAVKRIHQSDQLPEEYAQTKKGFYFYRAAMIACTLACLADEMKIIGQLQKKGDPAWLTQIQGLSGWLNFLRLYPPDQKKLHLECGIESKWQAEGKAPRSNSKRRGLGRLPIDWCAVFWESFPASSPYRLALAVLIASGCRPSELAQGVVVKIDGDGNLLIAIRGSKTHEGKYGQEFRELTIVPESEEARFLLKSVEVAQGTLSVAVKNAKALCEVVRRHSKKLWPRRNYVVSPYSFRHQFSADLKNDNERGEVAMALGHSTCKTQKYYGLRQQGRAGRKLIMVQAEKAPLQNQNQRFTDKCNNRNDPQP